MCKTEVTCGTRIKCKYTKFNLSSLKALKCLLLLFVCLLSFDCDRFSELMCHFGIVKSTKPYFCSWESLGMFFHPRVRRYSWNSKKMLDFFHKEFTVIGVNLWTIFLLFSKVVVFLTYKNITERIFHSFCFHCPWTALLCASTGK